MPVIFVYSRLNNFSIHNAMKFSIESTASYNSIHPAYHYTEQFANNGETYRDGTKWYGVFLAFLSGTFFTISSALVKAVRNVDPMILLAIRALMQILTMAVVACRSSSDLFGPSGQRILIHFQVKFAHYGTRYTDHLRRQYSLCIY